MRSMTSGAPDPELVQSLVALLPEVAERLPGLQLVYLFGSQARGQRHPGSDIDLAFLATVSINQVARFDVAQWLADALGADVDLIDLATASTVMQKEVVVGGALVHGSESVRAEFEGRVLSAYARLNEERRPILERIAREQRVHG